MPKPIYSAVGTLRGQLRKSDDGFWLHTEDDRRLKVWSVSKRVAAEVLSTPDEIRDWVFYPRTTMQGVMYIQMVIGWSDRPKVFPPGVVKVSGNTVFKGNGITAVRVLRNLKPPSEEYAQRRHWKPFTVQVQGEADCKRGEFWEFICMEKDGLLVPMVATKTHEARKFKVKEAIAV